MKKSLFLACIAITFIAEMIALIVFAVQSPDFSQDTVAVNEIVQSVKNDFGAWQTHENRTALDYTVLDTNGNLLYRTRSGLSESVHAAIAHRDTLLDIGEGDRVMGKVIVYNDNVDALQSQKRAAILVFTVALAVQCGICTGYALYMRTAVVKPFAKLKEFATRVASGNLDIPLQMDRRNLFGAFTESFDIMRSELKKARLAEAQAQQSKKELVAKLSHDIKTPVASIKAVAEVGCAVAKNTKDQENYARIVGKADQINALVTDLFAATLEELQQLHVIPANIESRQIRCMLENADYLQKASVPEIPDCLVYADPLRLQQVFDNIFSNSYKYAKTDITVTARYDGNTLAIAVEDAGGGVDPAELPALKEKFRRGSNAADADGAGLGLYIADYFLREMGGGLTVENGARGLLVTVILSLSGAI